MAYEEVGEVQLKQGDLAGALKSYQSDVATQRLSQSKPGNADWQRDLSVALNQLGDVQMRQSDLAGALKSYRDGLTVISQLAQFNPGNTDWQRDLSVSLNKVASAQTKQGNVADALNSYHSSLAAMQRLITLEPGNRNWQGDLSFVEDRIGAIGYFGVLAHDFATALQAVDEAIALQPNRLRLYANRANALMFLRRTDEARALYLKYRGQKFSDGKVWQSVVLGDFVEPRKAGLTNPLMDEIEKTFASGG